MKENNNNLDELFSAARREEPVISEENARELLRRSEHVQTSFTFFSTKGVIMTTIGLSLVALTAYFFIGEAPQKNNPNRISVREPQARTENLFANLATENKKTEAKSKNNLVLLPFGPVPILTPAKVTGVKPIVVSPAKFSKLGIIKEDDGKVFFSQKTGKGKIFTIGFPKNSWGILVIDDNDPKNVTDAPRFAPVIVTDTKGNKRLMHLSSEANGMKMDAIQIESRSDKDLDPHIDEAINNAMKISGIAIEKDSVQNMKIIIPGKNGGVKLSINNYARTDSLPLKNHRSIKIKKILRFDSLLKAKAINEDNVEEALKDINFDSTLFKNSNVNINIFKDEVLIDNDSVGNQTINKAEIEMNKSLNKVSKEMKRVNLDSIIQTANESMAKAEELMANYDKGLNNLLPILIRPATTDHVYQKDGITYDDGLIFWYKPEKEITDIIPEAAHSAESTPAAQNKASVITEAAIYPNPARTKATVHFTLNEPRVVAFSIHDLLGKRVLDCGSLGMDDELRAGSYDHELNLSTLRAGVYLLVITTDKGEQTIERLAIEK